MIEIERLLLYGFICGWIITVFYMSWVALRFIARFLFPHDDKTDR